MHLGEKIRQARLEAGLSQRQLCGNMITRNMLSQIENGSANPSMATLRYLSEQLGKSVGYFLQEDAVLSPNPELLQEARKAYGERKYAAVLEMGETYKGPDPLFDPEWHYLCALCSLAVAEQMVGLRDWIAAQPLLENIHRGSIYYRPDMERQRKQLLRQCYENLEQFYREREDFRLAYDYACKLRTLQL